MNISTKLPTLLFVLAISTQVQHVVAQHTIDVIPWSPSFDAKQNASHQSWLPSTPSQSSPAGPVTGDRWNSHGSSSGGLDGKSSLGYASATAPGNGTWVSCSGGGTFSEGYTITLNEAGRYTCQGEAVVEGKGHAQLKDAVGTARSAAKGTSKVSYGGVVVKAEDKDAIAIAAGNPQQYGIQTQIIGISTTVMAATGEEQSYALGEFDMGAAAEAKVAIIVYNRQIEYGFNINLGTASVEAEVLTAAKVTFVKIEEAAVSDAQDAEEEGGGGNDDDANGQGGD